MPLQKKTCPIYKTEVFHKRPEKCSNTWTDWHQGKDKNLYKLNVNMCVCVCTLYDVLSCSVVSNKFATSWTRCQSARFLCGDSPGKNTGVGYPALQGIFPTQGTNRGLLRCRQILDWLSYQESPTIYDTLTLFFC